jgi:heparan-alpha-glucosaminide N-acetyltransferase
MLLAKVSVRLADAPHQQHKACVRLGRGLRQRKHMATATADVDTRKTVTPRSQPAFTNMPAHRLVSLDAYRGFIMLLLVSNGFGLAALAAYPKMAWLAAQVDHAEWTGCTFWDLIQPAFTFMVGMAMPFSLGRRRSEGAPFGSLLRHVLWRAFVLILLSNILSNFDSEGTPRLQLINVLCQIAFGYLICFAVMQLRFRWQVAATSGLLIAYWVLFAIFPGPSGAFSQTGNIGQVIDEAVLGYNYSGYYTTINFIGNAVTIIFGMWAGTLVRRNGSHSYRIRILALCAVAGLAIGLALEPLNPMIKRLWTASFTFYSAGWVIAMLLVFYWLIEVKGYVRWTFPFIVFGTNSIFIYSFAQVLRDWLHHGIGVFTGGFEFLGPAGAIPQNLLTLAAMWYMCFWLYRRRIFFKI